MKGSTLLKITIQHTLDVILGVIIKFPGNGFVNLNITMACRGKQNNMWMMICKVTIWMNGALLSILRAIPFKTAGEE